jgi:hypothetical protein
MKLPPAGHKRWSSLQKATVVRAILDGGLSPCDARERYILSDEELTNWHAAYHRYGIAGLQAKSTQYRRRSSIASASTRMPIGPVFWA